MDMSAVDGSLTVEDVQKADSGTYSCQLAVTVGGARVERDIQHTVEVQGGARATHTFCQISVKI